MNVNFTERTDNMKFTIFTADCMGNAQNTLYPNKKVITAECDLKRATAYDHVCAEYKNNIRSEANFIIADVVPMDCDNDHSDSADDWITPEKLSEALSDVAFCVTYSRHHMLPKGGKSARPRFHVLFPVTPCSDPVTYKEIKKSIHKELRFFDANALDAARFLYGSANEVYWHEGSLSIEDWILMMKNRSSIPEGQRNNTMSKIAGKLAIRFGNAEMGHKKFLEFAERCDPPLSDEELDKIWKSACKFGNKVMSQEGYVPPDEYGRNPMIPDDFSDVGEARTLVDCYGDGLVYTTATSYLRYNGTYWEESDEAAMLAMIEHTDAQLEYAENKTEEIIQQLSGAGIAKEDAVKGGKKFKDRLNEDQANLYAEFEFMDRYKAFVMKYRNVRSLTSALEAAKPMVLKRPDELDSDPMLLNTPGGTYYLPDGLDGWRPTEAGDLLTKVTAAVPSEEGKELWENALKVFFRGDKELIDYVQLIGGMCIVGKVYTEAMIIAYGDGRNGKSTFWNVLYKVLGSYSGNISADALTVNCKRNVKPEMAELKGKRLIIAAELQEGMRLNTSVVKQLCSTDAVFAEKKFKAPFSFEPSHTLVLYTNHLPKVGASDDGTWRRLIVIPFDAKIDGTTDIKNYTQYLVDNAGGAVLAWLIEGARKLITADFKIKRPLCVKRAIGAYREGNDWLGGFIKECCEVDPSYREKSGELYKRYREYCSDNGEFTRSTTDFYGALEQAGYKRKRTSAGSFIWGVRLQLDFLK